MKTIVKTTTTNKTNNDKPAVELNSCLFAYTFSAALASASCGETMYKKIQKKKQLQQIAVVVSFFFCLL